MVATGTKSKSDFSPAATEGAAPNILSRDIDAAVVLADAGDDDASCSAGGNGRPSSSNKDFGGESCPFFDLRDFFLDVSVPVAADDEDAGVISESPGKREDDSGRLKPVGGRMDVISGALSVGALSDLISAVRSALASSYRLE